MVNLFITSDNIINTETSLGNRALHLAAGNGHLGVICVLLNHVKEKHSNDPDILKQFVNYGNNKNQTPLHLAVIGKGRKRDEDKKQQYMKICKALLSAGADPSIQTTNPGNTPLHYAASNGDLVIVSLLLSHMKEKSLDKLGEFVNTEGSKKITSLHLAVQNGNREVIIALLDNEANVNAKSVSGYTPLHMAAEVGNDQVVKILLQRGADVNTINPNSGLANKESVGNRRLFGFQGI